MKTHINFNSITMKQKPAFKRIRFIICISLVFGMASCADYLEEKPLVAYSSDQYYDSPKKLNMAVLGVYDVLSGQNLFGINMVMLDADNDLLIARNNTSVGNGTAIEDISHFNADTRNPSIENIWKEFYFAINRANNAISSGKLVPTSSSKDIADVKKFVAEAKALRAFCYLNLAINFGDVPLRTEPSDLSQSLFVPRSSRAEVYSQIVKDFEDAITDLPWFSEDAELKGRLTKGAAMALLSRAYLFAGGYYLDQDGVVKRPGNYLEYYKKADAVTKSLVESGKHTLNPNYEQIFKNICGNITEQSESMFEIDMAYLYGQSRHGGQIGTNSSGVLVSKYSSLYDCRPKLFTHYYAQQKFGTGDLRKTASIADYSLTGPEPTWNKVVIAVKSSGTWSVAKWRRDWHASIPTNWSLSDVNFVVIRYAEVLLMRAEILNEINNGPTPEAIGLVNMVRRRGYGLPVSATSSVADIPAASAGGKVAFFTFLTDEYARETLGEHHRKYHLLRWNLLGSKIAELGAIFKDPATINYHGIKGFICASLYTVGKSELYPIPNREIVENKGVLTQNPGYK